MPIEKCWLANEVMQINFHYYGGTQYIPPSNCTHHRFKHTPVCPLKYSHAKTTTTVTGNHNIKRCTFVDAPIENNDYNKKCADE